ncbi:glycosyl hydrolase family 17 protein [Flavobacterium lacus]|uniref:Endo-1,3-beta-glucanase btgC n=1 Tax=Flavobacterium lacus TaxID=1353778 RepID=A0A328WUR7_9FLAO|nr:glycosyl hydrolase family 17 protein [Flavobacterium lacus]RAR47118.1 exo-beta-1,3-glucanase (GH17 family) [Flavobacterium lacus]
MKPIPNIKTIKILRILFLGLTLCFGISCKDKSDAKELNTKPEEVTAKDILGNPDYLAISYGGYRTNSRRVQPTITQLKEDLKILSAMGIKTIRTYNVHLPEAVNILKAIDELNKEDQKFEMYVMLGAWIDCKNAWTGFEPNHNEESERNAAEIAHAVELAQKYPEIIKVIAVGNEAMVKWATAYYVQPSVILKWVNHLQDLKKKDKLSKDLWITCSDNFASWGGGGDEYHTEDLNKLIHAVDYISMHTYPMHDTHYNPVFWGIKESEMQFPIDKKIDLMMDRSVEYAKSQYDAVKKYTKSLGVNKPIHIGETGWATYSNELYGNNDSKAVDEYKAGVFYRKMREWTTKQKIACFYFEAFDEPWKDAGNAAGSENHFGLFTVEGNAKYAVWDLVDKGLFKDLKRDGNTIQKTYNGNKERLLKEVQLPGILK